MLNSQQMHISISNCINVEVSRIIVQAPAKSPNTDGIHVTSSTHVVIKDCTIRTGLLNLLLLSLEQGTMFESVEKRISNLCISIRAIHLS